MKKKKKNWLGRFIESKINNLKNSRFYRIIILYTKKNSLPGFSGVPIYNVFNFFFKEVVKENINVRANSIAFSTFISLFPSLIVLFTLIPVIFPFIESWLLSFLPSSSGLSFENALLQQLSTILPEELAEGLNDFIQNLVQSPKFGLLSAGFFLAIFFASNGMLNLMNGFEKSYDGTFVKRNGFQKRMISIFLICQVGFLVVISVLLIILGQSLIPWGLSYLEFSALQAMFVSFVRWLIIIALYYFAIGIIYRYAPAIENKLDWINPGTTLACILSLIASLGFSYYVDNFGNYNKLYGLIGTIIVLMIWLQINSIVILIGYELNASIAVNRDLIAAKQRG